MEAPADLAVVVVPAASFSVLLFLLRLL